MTNADFQKVKSLARRVGKDLVTVTELSSVDCVVAVVTNGPGFVRVFGLDAHAGRQAVMQWLDRIEYAATIARTIYSN